MTRFSCQRGELTMSGWLSSTRGRHAGGRAKNRVTPRALPRRYAQMDRGAAPDRAIPLQGDLFMYAARIQMPRHRLRAMLLLSAGLIALALFTMACSSPPYMQARLATPAAAASPGVEHGEGLFQ